MMKKDMLEKALEEANAQIECFGESRYAEGKIDKLRCVKVWLKHDRRVFADKYNILVGIYARRSTKQKFISMTGVGGVESRDFRRGKKANQYFDDLVKKYKLKELKEY